MEHPLDNPVWHALVGPHAMWAIGSGEARHYPREAAPFSAIRVASDAAYGDLANDLPAGVEARLFRPADEPAPRGWEAISARPILQMIAENARPLDRIAEAKIVPLGDDDRAAMLALAEAARPGPFGVRTHLLGGYVGVRRDGRLVAMAGERFRLPGFVELSAICVAPEARGAGLGAAVTFRLMQEALARGETPFLHVFPDNPAATLYRRLGFRERTRLYVLWRRPIEGDR
jgi:ribosomal protein S18 acetylase RimI-like enzyme